MIPRIFIYALGLLSSLFIVFYLYKESVRNRYKGAYFLPTKNTQVDTIINFLNKRDKSKLNVVDLGSGTGTILNALAKNNIKADGFEINNLLYILSYLKLVFSPQYKYIHIYNRNFWDVSLKEYNVVIIYGIGYMLEDIQAKIKNELIKGSIVISIRFKLDKLNLIEEKNNVFFYSV
jgi:16S rRNA A1518/A1519 N6-dimethyltransferase RsmA/KsgA/DIM1 with predicted DNA glycosylase/AP lyase activity